jgi:hypothetical protein
MKAMHVVAMVVLLLSGCDGAKEGCKDANVSKSNKAESKAVERQQQQYITGQPIPAFDFSLERQRVIDLYQIRNRKAATHSVWRSDTGIVEGDCTSTGYGIPYDTSLTNPLSPVTYEGAHEWAVVTVEQPEPNGVFASKNTAATWVLCLGATGAIEPVYVESKVTVYPGPVKVDYATNRVVRFGEAAMTMKD